VRDAQSLALAGEHAHEPAPAQHQRLQAVQFGIGRKLDEALALGMLVQHPGELA